MLTKFKYRYLLFKKNLQAYFVAEHNVFAKLVWFVENESVCYNKSASSVKFVYWHAG